MEWSAQFASLVPQDLSTFRRPDLVSLQIVSSTVIAFAFLGIAFASVRFVRGRKDLPRRHRRMTLMFALFMALGSLTYVGTVIDLHSPNIAFEAEIMASRSMTAAVTAAWLIGQIPTIRKMPSMRAMQREIAAHGETMAALDAARTELADRYFRLHTATAPGRTCSGPPAQVHYRGNCTIRPNRRMTTSEFVAGTVASGKCPGAAQRAGAKLTRLVPGASAWHRRAPAPSSPRQQGRRGSRRRDHDALWS